MVDIKMICFGGDVFLPTELNKSCLIEKDVQLVLNLEYPISRNKEKEIPAIGKVNLKASGFYIDSLFNKLPVAVSLANNHILDYGDDVALDTMMILDEHGVSYFGFGNEDNNYRNPLYLEADKVALFGYCCKTTTPFSGECTPRNSPAPLNFDKILNDIKNTPAYYKKIIILHWGMEEYRVPKPEDVILARRLIDSGADLIIGHHAHVIQSCEEYKGKYILYGLGNLYFPDLNVPRNYVNGEPQSFYIKKQATRNKKSLLVSYDPTSSAVRLNKTKIKNGYIELSKSQLVYPFGYITTNDEHFKLRIRLERVLNKIENFIANPKFPTISRIKSVLKV